MTKPAFLEWSSLALEEFPFQLSLEKEATYDEVYKSSGWKKKLIFRLVNLFGFIPDLAFQKTDVDMKIVEKILRHKDLLKAVEEWIEDCNYQLLPQLQEAKKVFEAIQKPPVHSLLYRGFKIDTGQQNSLVDQHYKKMQVGARWEYTPDKPMSFSWHKGNTGSFGNIIVSAEGAKLTNRCLHLTHEVVMALLQMEGDWTPEDELYIFTEAESVFLPDGKPIEFTLVKKG